MKEFVIGDIHGGHKALLQCFDRSKFDYDNDLLICLGDVVDGWPETPQCIEELLKIRNLIYIIGNHDVWAKAWLDSGEEEYLWLSQGGQATKDAYLNNQQLLTKHRSFFDIAKSYYIDDKNRLFVHGGFDPSIDIKLQSQTDITWDRSLFETARLKGYNGPDKKITKYSEVFIGHTSTISFGIKEPIKMCEVWNLDTGGGWEWKLSIMDINTKEYWQSDIVSKLYPNIRGRR